MTPILEWLEDRTVPTVFMQNNLVSDVANLAPTTDPNLKNPWGAAVGPTGDFSISNAANGTLSLYKGGVNNQPITVDTPGVTVHGFNGTTGSPSGQVFNTTSTFIVPGASVVAQFLIAGLDGIISTVGASSAAGGLSPQAQLSASSIGSVYSGLAIGNIGSQSFIFAANHTAGRIDVFNSSYSLVQVPGTFTDPNLPVGLTPFNVVNINGILFVTYENQTNESASSVVDEFNTNGNFIRRFADGPNIVAPWAVVQAPGGFESFGGDILIGNFDDGHISAYDPNTDQLVGELNGPNGQLLAIPGLRALLFGNGSTAGDANTLYFTAALNQGKDGLFGSITPINVSPQFITQVYTDLLQRPVDPAGLQFWDNLLDQGESRQQVVASIENTPEFQSIEVNKIFVQFLHRAADPAGLSFWTAQLAQGATIEQVESGIVGSREFFTAQGGSADAGFLTALYHDALGRTPDSTGLRGFESALANGASTAQVAAIVFGSDEFQTDLINGFYQQFLHRAPDSAGLQFFLQALQQGSTDQDVIAMIVGSDEYFSRL